MCGDSVCEVMLAREERLKGGVELIGGAFGRPQEEDFATLSEALERMLTGQQKLVEGQQQVIQGQERVADAEKRIEEMQRTIRELLDA